MSELMTPALSGAVAGLGVAMPMGAMSVLLLQEAMRRRRVAGAAAAGIATVDLGYAALATALGPWVASHVTPVEAWVRLASTAILLTIATHGLTRPTPPTGSRTEPGLPAQPGDPRKAGAGPRPAAPRVRAEPGERGKGGSGACSAQPPAPGAGPGDPAATPTAPAPAPAATPPTPGERPTARRAFARYVGLTVVNPTTALYFAALTTAQGAGLRTGTAGAAFLAGVGLASLLWQQLLVVIGSFAAARISPAVRVWTFRLGYGLVAAYALKIAFPLP